MRGEVLQYDDTTGYGLISGDDGVRYQFTRASLQQLTPLRPGHRVDFVPQGGMALMVFLLAGQSGPAAPAGAYAGAAAGYAAGPLEASNENLTLWQYFMRAMTTKFVQGEGRARRKEYWGFMLFFYLFLLGGIAVCAVLASLAYELQWNSGDYVDFYATVPGMMAILVGVVTFGFGLWAFIPSITVLIRRLHDIGLSGWMILLSLIPYLGGLVLFVMTLLPSQRAVNKHGVYPKPLD